MQNDSSFGIIAVFKTGEDFEFLLIQHKSVEGQGAHWAFPKGHANKGESEIEAAKREFKEETGISDMQILGNQAFFETYSFNRDEIKINKTVKYFLALSGTKDVNMQKEEIFNYKWLKYEDAKQQLTFSEGRDLLKEAHNYLKNNKTKL